MVGVMRKRLYSTRPSAWQRIKYVKCWWTCNFDSAATSDLSCYMYPRISDTKFSILNLVKLLESIKHKYFPLYNEYISRQFLDFPEKSLTNLPRILRRIQIRSPNKQGVNTPKFSFLLCNFYTWFCYQYCCCEIVALTGDFRRFPDPGPCLQPFSAVDTEKLMKSASTSDTLQVALWPDLPNGRKIRGWLEITN
jgi:hypothetical protein